MNRDLSLRSDTDEWRSAPRRVQLFDEAAAAYDRYRGGYAPELFDTLAALVPANGTVVEIGAGTGIATVPLAQMAAHLVALEPAPAMREIAATKLAPYPDVGFVGSTFENWEAPPASVDMIVAMDAWHWVDQESGPARAARLLRPGGHLAVAWHVRRELRPEVFVAELQRVCQRASPVAAEWLRRAADDGAVFLPAIDATGAFAPIARHEFPQPVTLTAKAFAGELGTFSWVLDLPDARRARLLDEVRALVERLPERAVTRNDANVLYLARRAG